MGEVGYRDGNYCLKNVKDEGNVILGENVVGSVVIYVDAKFLWGFNIVEYSSMM